VRCLSAFIRARGDLLKVYYEVLCDTLVSRFKERDHTVKAAVMAAMCDLLQTSVVSTYSPPHPLLTEPCYLNIYDDMMM
jgi:hypothetical protein